MSFAELPLTAAWRHVGSQDGFESTMVRSVASGHVIDGHTAAVEHSQTWAVHYSVEVDEHWVTQQCRVRSWSATGEREIHLIRDQVGRWRVDGVLIPELDGCFDVDLEASACTNLLPVRRADLAIGDSVAAPAAYVRAPDLAVERLDQTYLRLADENSHLRVEYGAPRFGFECELLLEPSGLVLEYPGIATRVA